MNAPFPHHYKNMSWQALVSLLDAVPWTAAIIAALTLGLAPFVPKPHIVEKLEMLRAGSLGRTLDIFDLVFHGIPWIILALKVSAVLRDAGRHS